MGCCKSFPNNVGQSSSVILIDIMAFEKILSLMPVDCRQQLKNLPLRRFLDTYDFHLAAVFYAIRKKYFLAIFNELLAIKELKLMLPHHEDHFIFANMYQVLCECYFQIYNPELAAEAGEIAVSIMLKHTPTDYKKISLQYYQLAKLYMIQDQWQKTEQYIVKAIEIGRLSNELPQGFIQALEQVFVMLR
jgi:tetratricopeptide (TPR) repeat protein